MGLRTATFLAPLLFALSAWAAPAAAAIYSANVSITDANSTNCICTTGSVLASMNAYFLYDDSSLADNFIHVSEIIDWAVSVAVVSTNPDIPSANVTFSAAGLGDFTRTGRNQGIDMSGALPTFRMTIGERGAPTIDQLVMRSTNTRFDVRYARGLVLGREARKQQFRSATFNASPPAAVPITSSGLLLLSSVGGLFGFAYTRRPNRSEASLPTNEQS